MKLTKLQRYTAYCIMLAEAENPSKREILTGGSTDAGLCFLYRILFDDNKLYYFAKRILPELYRMIPDKNPDKENLRIVKEGWVKRKQLLNQCIQETHP
jgi:hypothetical protein